MPRDHDDDLRRLVRRIDDELMSAAEREAFEAIASAEAEGASL